MPQPEPSCGTGIVGVDVGILTFVATSEGEQLGTSKVLAAELRRLRIAQRHLSRCQKGSNRRKIAKEKVAAIHRTIRNTRGWHAYAVANHLLDDNGTIAVEKLNVKGMMQNGNLARSIADASWAGFRQKLESVADARGGTVVAVKAAGTSQECSGCGKTVKKKLSDRVHNCPHCGLVLDRDVNAAINIRNRAIAEIEKTGGGRLADVNVGDYYKRCPQNCGKEPEVTPAMAATCERSGGDCQ